MWLIVSEYENFMKELPKITFVTDVDYIGKIWSEEGNRPENHLVKCMFLMKNIQEKV